MISGHIDDKFCAEHVRWEHRRDSIFASEGSRAYFPDRSLLNAPSIAVGQWHGGREKKYYHPEIIDVISLE